MKVVHPSIKKRLGYSSTEPDDQVLSEWRKRTRRVCKPCWELKYCPYGPFVEQSPLLPPIRQGILEHLNYLKECIASNTLGEMSELSDDRRDLYTEALTDDDLLNQIAWPKLMVEAGIETALNSEDPVGSWLGGPLPPIQEYRVKFEADAESSFDPKTLSDDYRKRFEVIVVEHRAKMEKAIETGIDDLRQPLDDVRRLWFQDQIDNFDEDDYSEEIPEVFINAQCNIFGHICPVYFAAESITETSQERRRGRYIPFKTKIRVVRRDNYTCQHCKKHLRDDEVEFDHIIPISKGGSSEEHNIRLTCFDCNRGKSDNVAI